MVNLGKEKGITIIVLIIAIIIMIVIAAITIGGINGRLVDYAKNTVIDTEEASRISKIQESYVLASVASKKGITTISDFQKQLDKKFGEDYATVLEGGGLLFVKIGEKLYQVDSKGKVSGGKKLEPIEYAGDITKGGTCNGSSTKPFRIECIEDLVKLSEMAQNGEALERTYYYLVVRDLDFNSIFSYSDFTAKYSYDETRNAYVPDEGSDITIKELCTTGKGFIPIGLKYSGGTQVFRGTFYGEEERTIKNIYIETTGKAGLFGACQNTTLRNITVDGNIVSTDGCAAGFVAEGHGITIEHCCNMATIKAKNEVAGFHPQYATSTTITACTNKGDITSESGEAYGISRNGTLNRCINLGNVTGYSYTAGIRKANNCKQLW